MVERKTGYVVLGKLRVRRAPDVNARAIQLIHAQPRPVRTITVDNVLPWQSSRAKESAPADARRCA